MGRRGVRPDRNSLITSSQVAALLQVHVKTVYRLAKRGAIPGSRIGRTWRFHKTDILELVSSKHHVP